MFLRENCLDSGNFPTQSTQLTRLFELPARLLETEVKDLLAEFALAGAEFVGR